MLLQKSVGSTLSTGKLAAAILQFVRTSRPQPGRNEPDDRIGSFRRMDGRMSLRNYSYRSLERVCRKQAELSSTPEAREVLAVMAREYRAMADYLEKGGADSINNPPATEGAT